MPATDTSTFAQLLTAHQSRLWAFVFATVADPHRARDVFQDTNRVLWEKAAEFDTAREFMPWACAIAKNQARAARQARARDRHAFDDDVVQKLADRAGALLERHDARQLALAECLQRLPREQRQIVERRYTAGEDLAAIGAALGRTANSIGVALFRIRTALARCIEARLVHEGEA